MKAIKYPSTDQFRNVVKKVSDKSAFVGLDENNNPIFDYNRKKPIIQFFGSVKLHGTNASVVIDKDGGITTQSRNNRFGEDTVEGHFGFNQFVNANKLFFWDLNSVIREELEIESEEIVIYGEWAGNGVQKKVAISELDKAFYMFGVKIVNEEESNSWLTPEEFCELVETVTSVEGIRNIYDYPLYNISIDFEKPEISQNIILAMTKEVEDRCPVAHYHGVTGLGEGIVFVGYYKGDRYCFKSKGEKHAKGSKVKILKEVDIAEVNMLSELANKVTPVWRLDQFYTEMCQEQGVEYLERKYIPEFINRVKRDVVKEDMDLINDAGVDFGKIVKYVSTISRDYFFNRELL